MKTELLKTFVGFIVVLVVIYMYFFHGPTVHGPTVHRPTVGSASEVPAIKTVEDEYPPCGEICQYNYSSTAGQNEMFTNIRKEINCPNIMKRMAYTKHTIQYPPPRKPPKDMYQDFTQNGKCPIDRSFYIIGFEQGAKAENRSYSYSFLKDYIRKYENGKNTNAYHDRGCVMKAIKEHGDYVKGKDGVVIGTQKPWLETMLLGEGIKHLTTLEYGNLDLEYPDVEVHTPYAYANAFAQNTARLFDFGATFSSLEHSGLGRYSDPLNPFGDLEAMAQAWCFMKPGGVFMLGLPYMRPGGHCNIEWNAHRLYGPERLQHMCANWNFLGYKRCSDSYRHIIVFLQKPLV